RPEVAEETLHLLVAMDHPVRDVVEGEFPLVLEDGWPGPERHGRRQRRGARLSLWPPGRAERPSMQSSMTSHGRSVLLLRLRARSPDRDEGREGPRAVQHRRGPRIWRYLLGSPGVLRPDERNPG